MKSIKLFINQIFLKALNIFKSRQNKWYYDDCPPKVHYKKKNPVFKFICLVFLRLFSLFLLSSLMRVGFSGLKLGSQGGPAFSRLRLQTGLTGDDLGPAQRSWRGGASREILLDFIMQPLACFIGNSLLLTLRFWIFVCDPNLFPRMILVLTALSLPYSPLCSEWGPVWFS